MRKLRARLFVTRKNEPSPCSTRRGAAARQLAIDRYSWQDIARRLERIYDEARGIRERETVAA